jgi:excisionase family DNA binding protein
MEESLLKRADVAKLLNVSLRTVDYLASSGKLRTVRIVRSVRFHPEEIRAFIAENSRQSGVGIL